MKIGYGEVRDALILICICIVIAIASSKNWDLDANEEQQHADFMDECTVDRKAYECTVLWRQGK